MNNEISSSIYNGDSLEYFKPMIESLDKNRLVIVSDPPFNIGYKYSTYKDRMKEDKYYEMLKFFFNDYPSVVIHYPENLYKLAVAINDTPTRVISWVYNSNTPRQHRDIAYFKITPDLTKVIQPYKNPNDKRIKKLIESGRMGGKMYDWINVNQVKNTSQEKTAHPCQMPVGVMKKVIGVLPDDAIIVDPFMGSGTTMVAVEEMNKEQNVNRQFIGIEIDYDYYMIAEKRMRELTKLKVIS